MVTIDADDSRPLINKIYKSTTEITKNEKFIEMYRSEDALKNGVD